MGVFDRWGRSVVRHPWRVILVWVVVAGAIIGFGPRLGDITQADQTSFIPGDYESAQAMEVQQEHFAAGTGTSTIGVIARTDGQPLSEADIALVAQLADHLSQAGIDGVEGAMFEPQRGSVAENGEVALVSVGMTASSTDVMDPAVQDAIAELRRTTAEQLAGTGLQAQYTGEAAILVDTVDSFLEAEQIVGIATIVLILVLQLLIFRSPIAALVPILTVGLVYLTAQSVIAWAGETFDFNVGQELTSILIVVLFGIGTDYILFLLFRFRERLKSGDDTPTAVATAVGRVGEVVTSAAGVIIVSLGALVLASLGFLASMGPALAMSVLIMGLAALTLVPAVLALLGPATFWPSRAWLRPHEDGTARRVGRLVAGRPGLIGGGAAVVLIALGSGTLNLQNNYDQLSQLPQDVEAVEAFDTLQRGFPAGALTPVQVFVTAEQGAPTEEQVGAVAQALQGDGAVGQVLPPQPAPDGRAVELDALLATNPLSEEGLDAIGDLRATVHEAADEASAADGELTAYVGGQTAAFADLRDAYDRDVSVVFPVAAALIFIILAVLLRALVAPLYLLIAVFLGFGASLGASVYVFQEALGRDGIIFFMPIVLYLFVVAIGTDYNILMISRLREEARAGNEPRAAAALAVEHSVPAIAAAGLILAGTFGSLMLAQVSLLTEMGFAVMMGVILVAFVVAMFLVPAITAWLGHLSWWPGHQDMTRGPGNGDGESSSRGRRRHREPTSRGGSGAPA